MENLINRTLTLNHPSFLFYFLFLIYFLSKIKVTSYKKVKGSETAPLYIYIYMTLQTDPWPFGNYIWLLNFYKLQNDPWNFEIAKKTPLYKNYWIIFLLIYPTLCKIIFYYVFAFESSYLFCILSFLAFLIFHFSEFLFHKSVNPIRVQIGVSTGASLLENATWCTLKNTYLAPLSHFFFIYDETQWGVPPYTWMYASRYITWTQLHDLHIDDM